MTTTLPQLISSLRAWRGIDVAIGALAEYLTHQLPGADITIFLKTDYVFTLVSPQDHGNQSDNARISLSLERQGRLMNGGISPAPLKSLEAFASLRDDELTPDILKSGVVVPIEAFESLLGFIIIDRVHDEVTDIAHCVNGVNCFRMAYEAATLREDYRFDANEAWSIQRRILPTKVPNFAHVECDWVFQPAKTASGDFFNVFELIPGQLSVVVGDVSGKGMPAAMMMAAVQTGLTRAVKEKGDRLAELLTDLNRELFAISPPSRYATLFYGLFDPKSNVLQYVNAGHSPPALLLRRGEEQGTWLDIGGPMVGLLDAVTFKVGRVNLQAGDFLIIATDGVPDSVNWGGKEWGQQLFEASALRACKLPGATANAVAQAISRDVNAFAVGSAQYDDITILVLRLRS